MSPGPKNGLERRSSRFSAICAKNQVLTLNICEVTVTLDAYIPTWLYYPVVPGAAVPVLNLVAPTAVPIAVGTAVRVPL
jgi:hypothetical protein